MIFQKFVVPSSVTTGNVFLNKRSTIGISTTTNSVRGFLRQLSLIKNMGNKILATIVEVHPINNMVFQLIINTLIPEVKFNCVISLANMSNIAVGKVIAIKTKK